MKSIGILRETYSIWERRSPLTPSHVKKLIKENNIKVYIQPCNKRIYSNEEYTRAGALVQDDLSCTSVILGVKQIKPDSIMKEKTYCFFSHTIKGQAENMQLLKSFVENKATLIDYECIAAKGDTDKTSDTNKLKRKVAFGTFAGRAGMIDTLRMIGEAWLFNHGVTTPFLNISSSYMYNSYKDALSSVESVRERLCTSSYLKKSPMVFFFTGYGNVTRGALDVFQHLNPTLCDLNDLDNTVNEISNKQNNKQVSPIIGCLLSKRDLVCRKKDHGFNVDEYAEFPERYINNLSRNVTFQRHCQVLVNGIYWDDRFPKIITRSNMNIIPNLISIADLSCDVNGSIELLSRSTTIEEPFLRHELDDGRKIYILGVDILPSELPKESSEHFGDQLYNYILELCRTDPVLSPDLERAIICKDGKLTERYKYLEKFHNVIKHDDIPQKEKNENFTNRYKLYGHIFDTHFVNVMLDTIENEGGVVNIHKCIVKPGKQTVMIFEIQTPVKEMTLKIEDKLKLILSDIENPEEAQGIQLTRLNQMKNKKTTFNFFNSLQEINSSSLRSYSTYNSASQESEKIVTIFGCGRMSFPALEYLTRFNDFKIQIVSNQQEDLDNAANFINVNLKRKAVSTHLIDCTDENKVSPLIQQSDVCLSLLPANLHGSIIRTCLAKHKDLVTSSYIDYSMDIKHMDGILKENGNVFLMELGVDPGIDHMSAKKIIDEIKLEGGKIYSFESYCGGLPKLEDKFPQNIFKYKFSWSPEGVLRAMKNDARYLKKGDIINIEGNSLLEHADYFSLYGKSNEFSLECLPNRDALKYQLLYSLQDCQTLFRGTLRYKGFSEYMVCMKMLGFLDENESVHAVINRALEQKLNPKVYDFVMQFKSFTVNLDEGVSAMRAFCDFLRVQFPYEITERDCILMEHRCKYYTKEGNVKEKISQLTYFGDNDFSAMAKTVGYSAAIGCETILHQKSAIRSLKTGGILIPIEADIYEPILNKLKLEGIQLDEYIVDKDDAKLLQKTNH